MANMVKIISSDNEVVEISEQAVGQSNLLLNSLLGHDVATMPPIPIPSRTNISGVVLRTVVAWCEHHKDDPQPAKKNVNGPKPLKKKTPTEGTAQPENPPKFEEDSEDEFELDVEKPSHVISDWDTALFEQLSSAQLRELLIAANFMEIVGLIECGAKKVAASIQGLDAETMRKVTGSA